MLRAHQIAQKEWLTAGDTYEDDTWLFAVELGRPYHPDSLANSGGR